jgi:hypothetical protein
MQATPLSASIAGALCLAAAACTSVPPPIDHMAVGRKAVERAGGTPDVVQLAPAELDQARAKIASAERAMAKRDYDTARRLADEAEADARAAEAHAAEVKNERALAEVNDALRALRAELARAAAG